MTYTTPTTPLPAEDSTPSKDRTTDIPAAAAPARRPPRPGWLLAIVLTGQLMAVLDVLIVNVAAPTMRADLHASGGGLQLVIAGYTIAYAVLLITGARLGALLGHRRMFLSGLVGFTAASLACGLATGTGQLIAFRFIQGAASAMMLPQVLTLIQRTYTGSSRARALGAYSAVLASGAAAGLVVGGVLVEADLMGTGWRPVFLVNVPIGLVLLVLGPRLMGSAEQSSGPATGLRGGLDLPGLLLLASAVLLFTVPMVLGQERDWPLWGWVMLGLSAVLTALFAVYETRLARRGGRPLISPRVVRAPGMAVAVIRIVLAMAANGGFLFATTLHMQGGLGYSAMRAGLTFVPCAVAFGVLGLNWQRLPVRRQPAVVPAGFALAAVSFLGIGLGLRNGGDGGPWLYVALAGVGAGLSLAYGPVLTRTLATVRQQDAADASGVLVTAAQLGLLSGVAVFGTVFLNAAEGGAPGARASADALWVTCVALAAAAACGTLLSLVRRLRHLR
ncbi:MFS transporter [Streptomyces sp. NPDC048636]|uniref:MFS transporter n=1 Tax=Streptomyces sp. NPDC048636 TaxID=3155762 RepID=UPI003443EFF3